MPPLCVNRLRLPRTVRLFETPKHALWSEILKRCFYRMPMLLIRSSKGKTTDQTRPSAVLDRPYGETQSISFSLFFMAMLPSTRLSPPHSQSSSLPQHGRVLTPDAVPWKLWVSTGGWKRSGSALS